MLNVQNIDTKRLSMILLFKKFRRIKYPNIQRKFPIRHDSYRAMFFRQPKVL